MTYKVFGGTLSLTQSLSHDNVVLFVVGADSVCRQCCACVTTVADAWTACQHLSTNKITTSIVGPATSIVI